jgi:GTP cyclohydrolase I
MAFASRFVSKWARDLAAKISMFRYYFIWDIQQYYKLSYDVEGRWKIAKIVESVKSRCNTFDNYHQPRTWNQSANFLYLIWVALSVKLTHKNCLLEFSWNEKREKIISNDLFGEKFKRQQQKQEKVLQTFSNFTCFSWNKIRKITSGAF